MPRAAVSLLLLTVFTGAPGTAPAAAQLEPPVLGFPQLSGGARLTSRVAQADVTVHGTSVIDDPRHVLILFFPEERARWRRGYAPYATTVLSRESTRSAETRLIRLPPGRYLAVAIDDPNMSYPAREGILEKLAPLAVPITLVAGQTTKVALRIANVSR